MSCWPLGRLSKKWELGLIILLFAVFVPLNQLRILINLGSEENNIPYSVLSEEALQNNESSSTALIPSSLENTHQITYKLIPNGTFNRSFIQNYLCNLGADCETGCVPRWKVPASLDAPRVFDFNTTVSTKLNILVMGDSLSVQMAQAMDGALGVNYPKIRDNNNPLRQLLKMEWGNTEGVTLSKVTGGGSLATFRINGWFLKHREGTYEPNSPTVNGAGGWQRQDVDDLLHHPNLSGGEFDVMFYRIQFGWIETEFLNDIDAIRDTILFAHEVFHVSVVILITVPFCNNVQTLHDLKVVEELNQKVRKMSLEWKSEGGLQHVLVMDLAHLIRDLMEENAKGMGYDIANETYWMDRVGFPVGSTKPKASIPHACGSSELNPDRAQCIRNYYSKDGMHFCMEGIGGRIVAAKACLLACAFNNNNNIKETSDKNYGSEMQQCAARCNDQYMSLKPLENNMFDKELT